MTDADQPRTVTAPDGQPVTYTADRGPVTSDGVHAAVPNPAPAPAPVVGQSAKPRKGAAK